MLTSVSRSTGGASARGRGPRCRRPDSRSDCDRGERRLELGPPVGEHVGDRAARGARRPGGRRIRRGRGSPGSSRSSGSRNPNPTGACASSVSSRATVSPSSRFASRASRVRLPLARQEALPLGVGLLPLGDVDRDADPLRFDVGDRGERPADRLQPTDRAVAADGSGTRTAARHPRRGRLLDRPGGELAVVGVDEREVRVERAVELALAAARRATRARGSRTPRRSPGRQRHAPMPPDVEREARRPPRARAGRARSRRGRPPRRARSRRCAGTGGRRGRTTPAPATTRAAGRRAARVPG